MVQKFAYFLLLLLVCSSAIAGPDDFRPATPEELALKEVPWSPGAKAVLLDWYVKHDDVDSRSYEYVRIKILTEEGKKYGDIELTSIPIFNEIRGIKARTIAPDGTISEFKGKIYDKTVVKKGGFKVTQKTFTLPNVVPGTIIEYRYMTEWPQTSLRTNRWALQREMPLQHASFYIRPWRTDVGSVCTTTGLAKGMVPQNIRDHYEFAIDKMPAFEGEPYSPPEEELKPRIEFFYVRSKPEQYWKDAAEEWGKWAEDYIGNRKGIAKAANEITAGATTSEDKLRKLYARVQQIRNLSYEPEKTEQEEKRAKLKDNNDIEDVWRNGYGYSGEINKLFAGLARAAGFEAHIVYVSSRKEIHFSQQLPDGDQLSDSLVVVRVDGTDRYFDPGTRFAPYGVLAWENTTVAGMRIKNKKEWEWVVTPDQSVAGSVTSRSADLKLVDGVVKGTATITYRGQEALYHRIAAMNNDDAENRKTFEDAMKAMLPDASVVKMTNVENLAATDEPLIITYDLELPNLGTLAGSRAVVPISLFEAASKNPFAVAQRKYPIFYDFQSETDDTVTLAVPDEYAVESVPNPVNIDIGALTYNVKHAQQGSSVMLERKMLVKTLGIGSQHYETLKKFYGARVTADHDAVVLKKKAGK